MDRGSLMELTMKEWEDRIKNIPTLESRKPNWTLFERLMGLLSPPKLDPEFTDLTDTWDYHYRTNRTGRDYPTPDENASIVPSPKHKKRSSTDIFEAHLAACRMCAESLLAHRNARGLEVRSPMCVVGRELQRRLDRDVFYRRSNELLLRR